MATGVFELWERRLTSSDIRHNRLGFMATGMCDLGRATELWLNHCKRLALNLRFQHWNILIQTSDYEFC